MRALFDVNVLIALLDVDHVHHARARAWLGEHAADGWASCPITQNGCVRIMSQPAYPNPLAPGAVIERLAHATRRPLHEFWPDDISLIDGGHVDADRVHGPKMVTDAYLLSLAVHHRGRFATFDDAIPLSAVRGASKRHLVVI
jgi:uncharacterized protein